MTGRQPHLVLAEDDALALIRLRIKEKRLFEARFLCRKLGAVLGGEQKESLERELNDALGQVEPLRQQARILMGQGEYGPAGDLYARIEAIAIDVPGVADEREILAGTEALAARLLHRSPGEEPSSSSPDDTARPVFPRERPLASGPLPRKSSRRWRLPRQYWLLAGVGVIVVSLLVVVFFRLGSLSKAPPPAENLSAQPLTPSPITAPSLSKSAQPPAENPSLQPSMPPPPRTEASSSKPAQPAVNSLPIQPVTPPPRTEPLPSKPAQPAVPSPPQAARHEEPAQPAPALRLGRLQIQ